MKKLLVGIDDTCRCNAIGSLVLAVVMTDREFFRKFGFLEIKDSKLLTRKQRDYIVMRTINHLLHFRIYYIKPIDMETENLNDLEMRGIVELLNSIKEFWEHNIYIDMFDRTKEKFFTRMIRLLPRNLKQVLGSDVDKLMESTKRWAVCHDADKKYKIVSLASIYARYFSDQEYDEIKKIHGDFGSGTPNDSKTLKFIKENPDCIHVRKSWRTYKNIHGGELNERRKSNSISSAAIISK